MISHALWTRSFGARGDMAGQRITLDATPYTIAGVLPRGFTFAPLGPGVDLWAPRVFDLNITTPAQVRAGVGFLSAVARLAKGVSAAQAQSEMDVLDRQYKRENPHMPDGDPSQTMRVVDLQQQTVANVRTAVLILSRRGRPVTSDRMRQRRGSTSFPRVDTPEGDRHSRGLGRTAFGADCPAAGGKHPAGVGGRRVGHRAERLRHACAGHAGARKSTAHGGDRHRLAGAGVRRGTVAAHGRAVWIDPGGATIAPGSQPGVAGRRARIGRQPAAQPRARRAGGSAGGALHGSAGGRRTADPQLRAATQHERGVRSAQCSDDEYRAAARALSEPVRRWPRSTTRW